MAETEKKDSSCTHQDVTALISLEEGSDVGYTGELGTSPTQERSEYNTASDLDDDDNNDDYDEDDLDEDSQTNASDSLEDGEIESEVDDEEVGPLINNEKVIETDAQRKADEDRSNPQYIPKRGTFYEHDDRMVELDANAQQDTITVTIDNSLDGSINSSVAPCSGRNSGSQTPIAQTSKNTKKWQAAATLDRWTHDRFDAREQAPKSRAELVSSYGYDIRNEDGPPRARRCRRYAKGPSKYLRSWEDEDAYQKSNNKDRKPLKPSDFPALDERPRRSGRKNTDRENIEACPNRHLVASSGKNERQQLKHDTQDNTVVRIASGRRYQAQADSRKPTSSVAMKNSLSTTMDSKTKRNRINVHQQRNDSSEQENHRDNNYSIEQRQTTSTDSTAGTHKDDAYHVQLAKKSQQQNVVNLQEEKQESAPLKQHQQQVQLKGFGRSNVMHRLQHVKKTNELPLSQQEQQQQLHLQQQQQVLPQQHSQQEKVHFTQTVQQQLQAHQTPPPIIQQQAIVEQRPSNLPKRYSVRRGQDIRQGHEALILPDQQSQPPQAIQLQQHMPLAQPSMQPTQTTQQQMQQTGPLQAPSMQQQPMPQGQLQPNVLQPQLLLQDQHMFMQLYQQQQQLQANSDIQTQMQSMQIASNTNQVPKSMTPQQPQPPQAIYTQPTSAAAYYVTAGVESAQSGTPIFNHSPTTYMPAPPVPPPTQGAPPPTQTYQNYNTVGGTTYFVPTPVQPNIRSVVLPQRRPTNAIPILPPNDKSSATPPKFSEMPPQLTDSKRSAEGPELRNIEKIDRILDNMFVARPAVKPHRKPPKAPKEALSKHPEAAAEKGEAAVIASEKD